MKTLRVTAALLLMASSATTAPALAQSAGFAPAGSTGAPATAVPGRPRGGDDGPSLSGRPWSDDRPRHPCGKRGRCRDRNFFFGYGPGYGHDRDFGYRDMMAEARNGYFNHGGEARGLRNGRVSYDYDRGYPYEYYRESAADDHEAPREYTARSRHCETELTHDRRNGRQVSVRVCRN